MACSISLSKFSTIAPNAYGFSSFLTDFPSSSFKKNDLEIFEKMVENQNLKDLEALFEDAHMKHATRSQIILLCLYSRKMPKDHENFQKSIDLFMKFLSQDFTLGKEDTVFGDYLRDDSQDIALFLNVLLFLWRNLREFEYLFFDPIVQLIEKINTTNSIKGSVRFDSEILDHFDGWAHTYNKMTRRKALVAHEVSQAIAQHEYKKAFEIYKDYKTNDMCNDRAIDKMCKAELAEIAVLENLSDLYASEIASNPIQFHQDIANAALKLKKFDVYTEHAIALFELKNYEHSYYLGALAQRLELNQLGESDTAVHIAIKEKVRCHSSEEYWRLGAQFDSDFQSQCQVAYGRALWRKNEQKQAMECWRAAASKKNAIANYYVQLLSFDSSLRNLAKFFDKSDSTPNHLKTFFDNKEERDGAYLNKPFLERKKIWIKQHGFKEAICSAMRVAGKVATLAAKYFLCIGAVVLSGAGGFAFGVATPFFGFPIVAAMTVCVAGIGASIAITAGSYYFTQLFNLRRQYENIFGDPQERWFPD